MIIYPESHDVYEDGKVKETNDIRLHCIVGPESDLTLDLFGCLESDITDVLKKQNCIYKKFNKNIKLMITFVDSEQKTMSMIQQYQAHKILQQKFEKQMQKGVVENPNELNITQKDLEQGVFVKDLVCSKCLNKGVYIKKGCQALCKDCLKIESGL